MIKAIIFDLDGTLVQTEILKARSYGKAIEQLSNNRVSENEVISSFKELVGLSRKEVGEKLIIKYYDKIDPDKFKIPGKSPAEILIARRLEIYEAMFSDKNILLNHSCKFNINLLKMVRKRKFKTGLATMSYYRQAEKVLKILKLENSFDYIITRGEVNNPKPNPEIYLNMLEKLEINKNEAIIIEDSVSGIKAALSAGVIVFAVPNKLTKDQVNSSGLIDNTFIINNRMNLSRKVFSFISRAAG